MTRRALLHAAIGLYLATLPTYSAIALEPSRSQEQSGARTATYGSHAPGGCLTPVQIRNDMTPMHLDAILLSCVAAKQMDNALFAFSLSGAFGYYDGLRVADPSARQAYRIIRMHTMGAFSAADKQAFVEHLESTLGNRDGRGRMCAAVLNQGPPTYYPRYMVQHGIGAMSAAANQRVDATTGLVKDLNMERTWNEAVRGYLKCDEFDSGS